MQPIHIYAISYGAAIAVLLGWRLYQSLASRVRQRVFLLVTKWLVYSLIIPRWNGSTNVTVLAGIFIAILFVGNIVSSVLAVHTQNELSLRVARLCITNLVTMYFGGGSSYILDRLFRLPRSDTGILHRWVGRLTLIEGCLHGTLELLRKPVLESTALHLSLLSLMGAIALFSIVLVRRHIYELFLRTHLLASVALLVLLWFHIYQLGAYALICVWTSAGLLVLQKALWLITYIYRNVGSAPSSRAAIKRYPQSTLDEAIIQIEVNVKRYWTVLPAQYVYLCLPSSRHFGFGVLESHPFIIAWATDDERGQLKSITLLARSRTGFTRRLDVSSNMTRAILDGPYGGAETETFVKHDTILLMSSGLGLAAQLNTARYLLLAHNAQTARLRRLTLVWLLELPDQIVWAGKFLKKLKEIDSRGIVVVYLFVPGDETDTSLVVDTIEGIKNVYLSTGTLHFAELLHQEWSAEAGSMLVSACGSPSFENCARKAVRNSPYDIHVVNNVFEPDECYMDKVSELSIDHSSWALRVHIIALNMAWNLSFRSLTTPIDTMCDELNQFNTRTRCSSCCVLAGCLRSLTERVTKERASHTESKNRSLRTSLDLEICRLNMHREKHKLLAALGRSEARCSRMNHLISHLVTENQRKDDVISQLEDRNSQQSSTELQCALSLMQLSSTENTMAIPSGTDR